MTFKLTMGDKLVREERATPAKTGSDLVRDFRHRLRQEAAAERDKTPRKVNLTLVSTGRHPLMAPKDR